jgi:hypothetical protein
MTSGVRNIPTSSSSSKIHRRTTTGTSSESSETETSQSQHPKSADACSLAELASAELEQLAATADCLQSFPAACRALLQEMEGNSKCTDCGRKNPDLWAAVSYGAVVCLQCAGTHRSLGVNVSTVRSVTMDHWTYEEVVKMLEGGNRQLGTFFQRHSLHTDCVTFQSPALNVNNISSMRYKTKAALFYRQQLDHHVTNLIARGPYKGRRRKRRPLGTQASNLE